MQCSCTARSTSQLGSQEVCEKRIRFHTSLPILSEEVQHSFLEHARSGGEITRLLSPCRCVQRPGAKFAYRVEEGVSDVIVRIYDAKAAEPRPVMATIT